MYRYNLIVLHRCAHSSCFTVSRKRCSTAPRFWNFWHLPWYLPALLPPLATHHVSYPVWLTTQVPENNIIHTMPTVHNLYVHKPMIVLYLNLIVLYIKPWLHCT